MSQSLSLWSFCSCLVIVILLFTGKRAALLGRTLVVAWKLSDLIWSQHIYSISIMSLSEREGNRRRHRRGETRRCLSDTAGTTADKGLFYVSHFVTGFYILSKHEITSIFLRMYLDAHQLTAARRRTCSDVGRVLFVDRVSNVSPEIRGY